MRTQWRMCLAPLIVSGCAVGVDDTPGAIAEPNVAQVCPVTQTIGDGAAIHGSNGIRFDADGRLRIASLLGNEIVTMDPESGEIIERMDLAELGGAPSGPDDLAFGPDGSLYWTSLATGTVARLAPDGTLSSQFVAPGTNPIGFSNDGRLFVGLDFFGDGLYELDPELLAPPRPVVPNQPGSYPLGFLNAFDFGPDGRLYGPLWLLGMIVSIDVNLDSCDGTLDPWTDCDIRIVSDGLYAPSAAKFDSTGELYATTWGGGEVLQISGATTASPSSVVVAQLAPGLDNLDLDAGDHVFVSSGIDGSITRIGDRKNEYVSPAGMILPSGVAVIERPEGLDGLFVADTQSLRELSPASGRQLGLEPTVVAMSALQPPTSVANYGTRLVLSSWLANSVQVWDPESGTVVESHALCANVA